MTETNSDGPGTTDRAARLRAARQYLRGAADEPSHGQFVELLAAVDPSVSEARTLERRVVASAALAAAAGDDPAPLAGQLPTLLNELRVELSRAVSDAGPELRDHSRTVREYLVTSIACVVVDDPAVVSVTDAFRPFFDALTTELDDETRRAGAKALCSCVDESGLSPEPAADAVAALLASTDTVVQAWSAGAFGRLAEAHSDVVATDADALLELLDHDDETVQHNAVEALGAVVRTQPASVVAAVPSLRALLTHEDPGIRHNAAGVLGELAETHPDAVARATDELQALCADDDPAVRQVATEALGRLPR